MSILDLPKRISWSDPIKLSSYRSCSKGPGVYVIGEPRDLSRPVALATDYDSYLGRWPGKFRGLYIGISESTREGIRGRLRSHARGRGSKGLKKYLDEAKDLQFIFMSGLGATNLETVYVHMRQPELFPLNVRSELRRQAQRF